MRWLGLFAVVVAAGVARAQGTKGAATQAGDSASSSRLTTLSGVYTEAQATRGKDVYAGTCRGCHAPQSHSGETFETFWRGKQLSELFTFVSTRMPKNDPGSLAAEDVADVVAYLLKLNAMPAGKRELSTDAEALKQYRIETKGRDSIPLRKDP